MNENPEQQKILRDARLAKYKKFFKRLWVVYFFGIASIVGLFVYLSGDLPSFEELENPQSRVASNVYSADDVLLGKYFIENRTPVVFDSLSPHLVKALVATEDARYYNHSGIDVEAIGRVIVVTGLMGNRNAGGGSTISQQLAKLLVGRPNTKGKSSLTRAWLMGTTKFKEWLTAVKLERSYTKQEIIALYFNEFDFLYGANGIKSAAEIYFDKQPHDLSINEAAMLVRMLKNPSLYNPRKYPDRAKLGREQVLYNLKEQEYITEPEYHELRQLPVDVSKFRVKDHNDGLAPYFRMHLRDHLKELLVRLAKEDKQYQKPNGNPYDIYRDGLKIYTTIDSRIQAHAEKAVWDHLKNHQEKFWKVWSDWDKDDTPISVRSKNPWTYKLSKNTDMEMEMRRIALLKQVWKTERYRTMRKELMPTVINYELRDIDVDRILQIVDYDKEPRKKNRQTIDGKKLLQTWKETGFVTNKQAATYEKIMLSKAIDSVLQQQQAMDKYMRTPVEMTIFAYTKRGEKDTLMSPFDSIKYHRMFLQTGSISVDPKTGQVKSWVGGINYKYFQFDHVNKEKFARQVGSTIKPFLYGLAVQIKGYSPCQKVWDQPTTISKGEGQFGLLADWTPNNVGGYSGDEITLTEALNRSLNSVSAYLMKDLKGTKPFVDFLANIGIDTSNQRVPSQPSICLGTPNLSPYEMAGGYTIFANEGVYTEPVFIDRIEDKNGNIIYTAGADQKIESVLSEQDAYVMNSMLQRIQSGRLRGVKSDYGGKTGTTNSYADGWFMGITPNLVVGTWVGCDDRYIRFKGIGNGQGARMARPIFQNLLLNLEADSSLLEDRTYSYKAKFPMPNQIDREMNCIKFQEMSKKSKGTSDATSQDIYDEDY